VGFEPTGDLSAASGFQDRPDTRTLLRDPLHAAYGVEYHAERVLAALDQAQREQDAQRKANAASPRNERKWAGRRAERHWRFPRPRPFTNLRLAATRR
jgi:hypothetical protein